MIKLKEIPKYKMSHKGIYCRIQKHICAKDFKKVDMQVSDPLWRMIFQQMIMRVKLFSYYKRKAL
jgi:hypothetical protein